MHTARDREILSWLTRVGAAEAGHVMRRFGMGRSKAYERLARLTELGLVLHRRDPLGRRGLYSASRQGLRACGQAGLGLARPRVAEDAHTRGLTAVLVELELALAGWDVLGERELRWLERDTRQLIGSARLGAIGDDAVIHRPDAVLLSPAGRAVAVELELTAKAQRRLVTICRGYARARHLHAVYYLAAPPAARALSRAVKDAQAQDRITVLALDGVSELIAREFEGVGLRRNTA